MDGSNLIEELAPALEKLSHATIDEVALDLCAHTLTFKLRVLDKKWRESSVRFDGVTSFYYIDGTSGQETPWPKWDYAELTGIAYSEDLPDSIVERSEIRGELRVLQSMANFEIEFWDSHLFIEAGSIAIDGRVFEVSYPKQKKVASRRGN